LIRKFCYKTIKACNGVDLTRFKPIKAEIVNGELYDLSTIKNRVSNLESSGANEIETMKNRLYWIEKVLVRLYNNIANNIFYDKQINTFEELLNKTYENKKDL